MQNAIDKIKAIAEKRNWVIEDTYIEPDYCAIDLYKRNISLYFQVRENGDIDVELDTVDEEWPQQYSIKEDEIEKMFDKGEPWVLRAAKTLGKYLPTISRHKDRHGELTVIKKKITW